MKDYSYYIKTTTIQNYIKLDLKIGLEVLILAHIINERLDKLYILDQAIS
jgi:hypothetical protein